MATLQMSRGRTDQQLLFPTTPAHSTVSLVSPMASPFSTPSVQAAFSLSRRQAAQRPRQIPSLPQVQNPASALSFRLAPLALFLVFLLEPTASATSARLFRTLMHRLLQKPQVELWQDTTSTGTGMKMLPFLRSSHSATPVLTWKRLPLTTTSKPLSPSFSSNA